MALRASGCAPAGRVLTPRPEDILSSLVANILASTRGCAETTDAHECNWHVAIRADRIAAMRPAFAAHHQLSVRGGIRANGREPGGHGWRQEEDNGGRVYRENLATDVSGHDDDDEDDDGG